jgi:hypothetical protein
MEEIKTQRNSGMELQVKDVFCMIKNKKDGFYWVLNLEDHPSSFLLDRSYQNFLPPHFKEDMESLVIFQPTI